MHTTTTTTTTTKCERCERLEAALRDLLEQVAAYEENGWLGEYWRTRIGLPADIAEAR